MLTLLRFFLVILGLYFIVQPLWYFFAQLFAGHLIVSLYTLGMPVFGVLLLHMAWDFGPLRKQIEEAKLRKDLESPPK